MVIITTIVNLRYTLNIDASKSVKRVDQVKETRLCHPRNRSHITVD